MSDKKEIHVKDLVIKADNVVFEQKEKHHPFFSPRNEQDWEDDKKHEKEEAAHDDHEKHEDDEHDHHRPPFFWI